MAKKNTSDAALPEENNLASDENSIPTAVSQKMANASDRLQVATDKLTRELETLVEQSVETIQRVGKEYIEKMNTHAAEASDRAKLAYKEGEAYVRENPLPSVLGSFAIGVLLGILLRRD
jgi:ElaB/YqjD/DUF883 family membrane-anchored ribosome-binding protein